MPGVILPETTPEVEKRDESRTEKIPPYKVIFFK